MFITQSDIDFVEKNVANTFTIDLAETEGILAGYREETSDANPYELMTNEGETWESHRVVGAWEIDERGYA